ncbi:MAG: hypothetical protein NUW02_00755 [Candidatus Campbellbacteria bacterium]|nr:hypothetical protein [Candidatus Campbellbacteria bacterium]
MKFAIAIGPKGGGPHKGFIAESEENIKIRTARLREHGFTIVPINVSLLPSDTEVAKMFAESQIHRSIDPTTTELFEAVMNLGIKIGWKARGQDIVSHISGCCRKK